MSLTSCSNPLRSFNTPENVYGFRLWDDFDRLNQPSNFVPSGHSHVDLNESTKDPSLNVPLNEHPFAYTSSPYIKLIFTLSFLVIFLSISPSPYVFNRPSFWRTIYVFTIIIITKPIFYFSTILIKIWISYNSLNKFIILKYSLENSIIFQG